MKLIGGKWKALVLFHVMKETKRFNQLQRELPFITRRMLTLQLRELEADGIVHREVFQQVPPKVEYSITELGESLRPTILSLKEWGQKMIEVRKYTRSE
jgi:DNA-binding HxlR family transcriptional regulator